VKTRLLIILFLLTIVSCSENQFSKIKIESYDIKTSFDTTAGYLYVKATIQINMEKNYDDKINLLFSRPSKITKILFTKKNVDYPVSYHFDKETIIIDIPKQLQINKQLLLNLEYQFPIDYFTTNKVFKFFRNFNWCPFQYSNFTTFKIEIETPKDYEAYSSGDLVESKNDENHSHYIWENNCFIGFLLIITPKHYYSVIKRFIDNKELNFYFINIDTSITNIVFDELCKSFHYYNTLLGEYRHKQLNLYEIPDSENYALSLGNSIICSNNLLKMSVISNLNRTDIQSEDSIIPSKSIDSISNPLIKDSTFASIIKNEFQKRQVNDTLIKRKNKKVLDWISHETAHQWIGYGFDYLFDSRLFKFISEGLTEYVRYMFIEDEYGKDSLNSVIKKARLIIKKNILNTEYDIPLSSNSGSSAIPYIKGPLVFHYVRQQIGDDNWKSFLRTLYNKYYGKVIDYNIFKAELSKYDKTGKVVKRMEEMTEMTGVLPMQ
jgi:aminopeptidase N